MSDCPSLTSEVCRQLTPSHHLQCAAFADIAALEEPCSGADAVLVVWREERAAAVAAIAHATTGKIPVIALHRPGSPHRELPLLVGAFATLALPLDPALLQASVLVYERMYEAARRSVGVAEAERRAMEATAPSEHPDPIRYGPLVIDVDAYVVTACGQTLELPPRQFALLLYLVRHAERVLRRHQILEEVWELDFEVNTNVVDVYVHYLRKQFKAVGLDGAIQTVRGVGYRLVIESEDSSKGDPSPTA